MLDNFKALFNLAEVGQSRSSITNPLQWTMVILLIGMVLAAAFKMPWWVLVSFLIAFLVVLALFIYAYVFCMHTNPDVLRSENYHLSKMAIEHGLLGDSLHGLGEATGPQQPPKLLEGRPELEGGK